MTPQPDDIIPFEALERTLANDLKVIVVPTGFPNLVSLQIPVQTGSRNEVEVGKSGFAHFFEHMMFRGTKRFTPEAYQDIVTRTGARQNAYTTDDYTNYHTTFAKEDLATMLDIEADRFMNLEYAEEAFKTEARAVLGEYNKSASDPLNKLIEVQREHAFSTHTYKHTTMGFIADIEDMPNQFSYSKTFFERWYRPEYTTVIVAGDVEAEAAAAMVERYFGPWNGGAARPIVIPQEPPQGAPVVAHVPWPAETLPWVTVAVHGPAFSENEKDYAAMDVFLDLLFGGTSDLYQKLVEREQVVDQLFPYFPSQQDAPLASVLARVKQPADMAHVRDEILRTLAGAIAEPLNPRRVAEAISHNRYAFARTLDNSESIAGTLARFVRFRRSFDTVNQLFRVFDSLTTEDVHRAAARYVSDDNIVVTSLAHEPLDAAMAEPPPKLSTFTAAVSASPVPVVALPSPSTLLRFKLQFAAGSAHDPAGKEGLAQLAASMVTDGGSSALRIDEVNRALFPMAGSFGDLVDREMTTFTGAVHRDRVDEFLAIVLPQLLEPGYREEDFARLREQQFNALVQDLRASNDEELGKERLQANIFAGSAYGHPTLGTEAGLRSITLEDVRGFITANYTRTNLVMGVAGDAPKGFVERLQARLASLAEGGPRGEPDVVSREPDGIEVEIIAKDTRATAISFGHPIQVTRSHPDFAALWLGRAWLGEHRASNGRLYQRIREIRGMNYGDYAYIEAFPRGMYQFFPDANIARRAQIFEIWIRPVPPEQAVFALKIALYELDRLIRDGLSEKDFEDTRDYLAKNVFVMIQKQDQQLGYALDSRWYGTGEFTAFMREQLSALTVGRVNEVIRRHLSSEKLSVVAITADAERLRDELLSDARTEMSYGEAKPADLLAEDLHIGGRTLGVRPEAIRITPVSQVFAK